jgi:hypothetical protein
MDVPEVAPVVLSCSRSNIKLALPAECAVGVSILSSTTHCLLRTIKCVYLSVYVPAELHVYRPSSNYNHTTRHLPNPCLRLMEIS